MKTARFLLIFATGACLSGTAAIAADESTRPARPRRAGPPSPEMQAWHQQALAIYDTDKSGTLDETERSVLEDDIAAGTMQPPPLPPGGRGRGRPMGPPPEIVAKYDTDKDGKLSETERATLEADIAAGKLPPPPPPPGAHPPSGDGTTSAAPAES